MRKNLFLALSLIVLLLSSCGSPKRITYFRDMEVDREYPVLPQMEFKIQPGDRLNITVDSKNAELIAPFATKQGAIHVSSDGEVTAGQSTGAYVRRGYLVDSNGEIDFPVLGKFRVSGMTHKQLADFIKKTLSEQNYVQDAIVDVELLNMKVLLLKETGGTVVSVSEDRLSIMEAITRSGGISSNGKMNEVAVVREEGGVRKMYHINLNEVSLFESPVYWLQQNDIVYVAPRTAPDLSPRTNRIYSNIITALGFATTIFSFIILSREL